MVRQTFELYCLIDQSTLTRETKTQPFACCFNTPALLTNRSISICPAKCPGIRNWDQHTFLILFTVFWDFNDISVCSPAISRMFIVSLKSLNPTTSTLCVSLSEQFSKIAAVVIRLLDVRIYCLHPPVPDLGFGKSWAGGFLIVSFNSQSVGLYLVFLFTLRLSAGIGDQFISSSWGGQGNLYSNKADFFCINHYWH